ncbi:MAG: DUF2155 domain-containing protein [Yoonia sp.]|uniref:DUF2155 domain-containing protein n=1 Tax=Yoonia sp. TaxID=2212373 RepID=UPI003EF29575
MRKLITLVLMAALAATSVSGQDIETTPLDDLIQELSDPSLGQTTTQSPTIAVQSAVGGELRVLDKLSGAVADLSILQGETAQIGFLSITLQDCRFPVDNPSGDAFAFMDVVDRDEGNALFSGWMLASSPALNAMEHPRYDVWVLRCMTS